jgi:hypothetical protein
MEICMTVEEFAAITQRVITQDGFEDFLPTACNPGRRDVRTLRGLPPDIEAEPAVLKWAVKHAQDGEEFLVAFKSGPSEFSVVRQEGKRRESGKLKSAE